MRVLAVSLLYVVFAHAATLTGRGELRYVAVMLLVALLFLALRGMLWLQVATAVALAATAAWVDEPARLMMFAPPVLFPLLAGGFFARSLRSGRQPLVERIVWHMHGQPAVLDGDIRRYARGVTVYWVAVFVVMAMINLALAVFATPAGWSWGSNIASALLPVVALLAEYAWRKRVFPVQQYRNIFDYLARVVRLGPTLARDFGHDWQADPADATRAVRS